MPQDVTYPPLDVLKEVVDELVWIVDSGPQHVMGLSLPVRMTVIRLPTGEMLLHSPTRYDANLHRRIETRGPIRHLVAPNSGHWTHLAEWQRHCPEAVTSAAPGLRDRMPVRRAGLRLNRDLTDTPPEEWAGTIEQIVVPGALGFREVALFHQPTRTLVLTDLVQNLEPDRLPPATRFFARLTGSAAPNGTAPAYLRLALYLGGRETRDAAARLLAWAPERVIFSHGRWFDRNGTPELRRALGWLVG